MTRLLLAVLLTAALALPARAHRQPEVETTVEVIPGTVSPVLGITHRLHAHDALTLLRVLGEGRPDLEDETQLARLAVYAADALTLTGDAASNPFGAEVEGNYVFVYVQHPEVAGVTGSVMLDCAIPGWTNTVHAKGLDGATTRSVTFSADRVTLAEGTTPITPGGLTAPTAEEIETMREELDAARRHAAPTR